ncbi:MAG TPA: hypothetical protein VFW38_01945 [Solirubrobacteraceae bacterium]|nr:hypothetical protein [Solirubrobacteraceae bacterium]
MSIAEQLQEGFSHSHFPEIVPEVGTESGRFFGEVFAQLFRLVTENLLLLYGLAGLVVCIIVAKLLIGLVSGKAVPTELQPLPGNTESVYHLPGSQGTLF